MSRRVLLLVLLGALYLPLAIAFRLYARGIAGVFHCGSSSSSSSVIQLSLASSLSSPPQGETEAAGAAAARAAAPATDVSLVKKLRQLTGAGYGSCVKALKQSQGDLPKALQYLRKQGAADAAAAAAAAIAGSNSCCSNDDAQQQGIIALYRLDTAPSAASSASEEAKAAAAADTAAAAAAAGAAAAGVERVAAVRLACATDFVSRSKVFTTAARRVAAAACLSESLAAAAKAAAAAVAAAPSSHREAVAAEQQQRLRQQLLSLPAQEDSTFPSEHAAAEPAAATTVAADLGYVSKLVGERIVLSSVTLFEAARGAGIVSSYCHQPLAADAAPIVVLLKLSYEKQQQQQLQQQVFDKHLRQFGKQLCMHIAATKPLAVRAEDLPATLVAQERQFAVESLNSSSSSSKKSSSSSNSSKKSTSIGSSKKVMSEALQQKIIEGKMNSWLRQTVLLKQPWALDDSGRSVQTVLRSLTERLGASMGIDSFVLLEAAKR